MHYPLTDIQTDFEINWPIRYQITVKKSISTDGRQTGGQVDGRTDVAYNNNRYFFRKKIIKTSENEIVLTCYRNAIRNANTPIGHNIALLRITFGTDIVNNEITLCINLPTVHLTIEQHVLLST